MSLAPRAVLVHRTTEYEELVARHGTHGQAAFFLSSRGRDIEEVAERHRRTRRAMAEVTAAIPLTWRQTRVERTDLDRFLFAPEDVVVVVGQDGLVANVAKYLSGQPVVGIDTDPGRNPGVLVRHRPADARLLLPSALAAGTGTDGLTMVEAVADDTQRLLALNEIYLGAMRTRPPATAWASTTTGVPSRPRPPQGCWWAPAPGRPAGSGRCGRSGAPGATGARAFRPRRRTGWCGSCGRPGRPPRPAPRWSRGNSRRAAALTLTVESERLIAFGDGIESDAVELTWGQRVRVGRAETALRLVG